MATKFTALTVDNAPTETDILAYTEDPAGTPVSKSTTVTGLHDALESFGEIHREAAAGAGQTISTTYVKINQFDTDGASGGSTTTSHANDQITVGKTGEYQIFYSLSVSGTASTTWTIAVHVDAAETLQTRTIHKLGTGGDVVGLTCSAILDCTAGEVLDVRAKADGASKTFVLEAGQFGMHRI
jgi:hypothetical protein